MYIYRIELARAHKHVSFSGWKLALSNKAAFNFWKRAVLSLGVMAFRLSCCLCHLVLGVCNKFLPGFPHEGAAMANCGETIATTTEAVNYRRNSSAALVCFWTLLLLHSNPASSLLLVCLSRIPDAVPEELAEPLYRDQYNQEHLKPPVACLLQSAELYCRAGSLILRSDAVKPLLGHNAVIQALAQKGLYVTDQDRLVTERDLTCTPIHMVSGRVHSHDSAFLRYKRGAPK